MHGNENSTQLQCECGQIICYSCGETWHKGKTCQQVLDDDFKLYSSDNKVKWCPRCKSKTEKTAGCNHMTCALCKFEYCWRCLGEFEGLHVCRPEKIGRKAYTKQILANVCTFFALIFCSIPVLIISGIFYAIELHLLAIVLVPGVVFRQIVHPKNPINSFTYFLCFLAGTLLFPILLLGYVCVCCFDCVSSPRMRQTNDEIKRMFMKVTPKLCTNEDDSRAEEMRIGCLFAVGLYFIVFLVVVRNQV